MRKMRHNCAKHGCWKDQHMTPLGLFDPAFPDGQGMTDVDAVIERRGQFLLFECKKPGVPIPKGQEIMLRHLSLDPLFTVGVLWGRFKEGVVTHRQWFTDGQPGEVEAVTLDDVLDDCRDWYGWASENGFPVVAGDGVKMGESKQKITREMYVETFKVIRGWRKWSWNRDGGLVRKIEERNRREMEEGNTPLPPTEEVYLLSLAEEFSGSQHIPDACLHFVTLERWLMDNADGNRPFMRWLRHNPSPVFTNVWEKNAGKYGDLLRKMIEDLGCLELRR